METLAATAPHTPEAPSKSGIDMALDAYCQPLGVRERMEGNYELLEDVGPSKDEEHPDPFMTICIPVALLQEDQATIDRTLDAIHTSQKTLDKPIQVILWANARYEQAEQAGLKTSIKQRYQALRTPPKAAKRYEKLRASLGRFDGTGLEFKTALQVLPEEDSTMSQLRSNYMDSISILAQKEGYGYDHPIMWLDADTTYITANTLGDIGSKVKNFDALFVHAAERYTMEWAKGKPRSELDDETKSVMLNEIHRRITSKKALSQDPEHGTGYTEESGLAFAVGTYLDAGGVDINDPINEAGLLIKNGRELLSRGNAGFHRDHSPNDETEALPSLVEYVRSARIGLSARRHYRAVKAIGVRALYNVQFQNYSDYTLFSDRSSSKAKTPPKEPITRDGMHKFIRLQESANRRRVSPLLEPSEEQQRLVGNMVDANFKD
jgi:hypothetical protein